MKNLEETRTDLAYLLLGTCTNISVEIERLELDDLIDWEDEMLTAGVEPCKGCAWWHESGDLIDNEEGDDSKTGYCPQCREEIS